jgi:2-polyprenyl-3-methyl-5-hydroxy-6-metoxy-1,4-benzoquinol methylase
MTYVDHPRVSADRDLPGGGVQMSDQAAPERARAEPAPWDAETALRYWDERHAEADEWRSGGNISFSRGANAISYAVRLVRIVEAMDHATSDAAPLRVLDAGCGRGYFSRGMASFGHQVDGVDASPNAIRDCRERQVGREHYAVSVLSGWQPGYLYDVVFSVDVLFHVMDDEEWHASVVNLAALVRLGGLLMLGDHDAQEDRVWSAYQKTRARGRYVDAVTPLGFEDAGFRPNGGPRDPVGLNVFRRVA